MASNLFYFILSDVHLVASTVLIQKQRKVICCFWRIFQRGQYQEFLLPKLMQASTLTSRHGMDAFHGRLKLIRGLI